MKQLNNSTLIYPYPPQKNDVNIPTQYYFFFGNFFLNLTKLKIVCKIVRYKVVRKANIMENEKIIIYPMQLPLPPDQDVMGKVLVATSVVRVHLKTWDELMVPDSKNQVSDSKNQAPDSEHK